MYAGLREFLTLLDREGELVRVATFVSPIEEMTEIIDRMVKNPGGKAVLFENTGTPFPVAMNLFGSERRMALALGASSLDRITERIERVASDALSPKGSLSEKIQALPLLGEAARWFPKRSEKRGKCQQIILKGDDAQLGLLPILKCWPYDGGRFITLPIVNTVHPETGTPNAGMYRMQIFGDHTTGMHWHIHKTGAKHYDAYRKAGRRMPVSICLGGDPIYTYSATAPLPEGIDEYLLAGFLRNKPVHLVKSVTNGIYIPSDCDFVIEGYVDPVEEKVLEGPFGDHTGFYSLEDLYPRFHVTAITHRNDAVFPATVVGIPPQEDFYIAKATEKIFLTPLRMALQPELKDMYMPSWGVAHNLAVISMEVRYPGHVRQAVASLWGAGQMAFNKFLLVAPSNADIRNMDSLAKLIRGIEPQKSVIHGEGVLDILDHATTTPGYGGKMAIDLTATATLSMPEFGIPSHITPCTGIDSWDFKYFAQWGIVILYAKPGIEADVEEFVKRNCSEARFAVLFDTAAKGLNGGELLWLGAANSDAARDTNIFENTVLIDARPKLPGLQGYPIRFPNVVTSSEATVDMVNARWEEYGIGEFLESPSNRYGRLRKSDTADTRSNSQLPKRQEKAQD